MRYATRFPMIYREVLLPVALFLLFLLFLLLVLLAGCGEGADPVGTLADGSPPAPPAGLRSTTGDNFVTLTWRPNVETDLEAYHIYYSFDDVNFHLTATTADTNYVDLDVRNGNTYYYAVSAFDIDGNESELSRESVFDTPRPAGYDVQLVNGASDPTGSAFSLRLAAQGAGGVVSSADSRADFCFRIDPGSGSRRLHGGNTVARNTWMIDMGTTTSLSDIDQAPSPSDPGWVLNGSVSLVLHHTYVLQTEEGNYAQVRVTNLVDDYMIFDWGYQLDPYNPELAPILITETPSN